MHHDRYTGRCHAVSGTGAPGESGTAAQSCTAPFGACGWAVVEANAAWASGHYACDVDAVLDVVLRAARPRGEAPARDAGFLRHSPSVVRR
ncbi:hypothetical protein [Streptomyces sp. OZ13]|uniref:hypothetical protein n=1 Tax=Streptomyces sp. OZ13 TaxID=3452210 RepID=UPI003F88EC05